MSHHSQSSAGREYFSPYSLRPRDDHRYSNDPTPTSQSYLLPPQIASTLSQPASPHYTSTPYTSIDHPSYPHSAPTTPLPHPSHVSVPSSHGGAYLDAYPEVHHIPMHHVIGIEHMDTGLSMDLNVLSRQEHPDYQLLQREGLAPDHRRRGTSAESMDSNPDGHRGRGGKKQRGRPRLDTKDENAADRRRTQIRLAQRAYRMRKETTITSLKSRVEELEGVIDSMKNLFFELEDAARVRDSQDADKYLESIGGISDRFEAISHSSLAAPTSELGGDSQNEDEDHRRSEERSNNPKPRSRDGDSGAGPGSSTSLSITNTLSATSASSWGYPTSNTRSTSDQGSGQPPSSGAHSQHSDSSTSSSSYLQAVTPEPETMLENSYSYYFQDASFSRRLHRAALDRAVRLLTDPNVDEDKVNRTFAYTFCYRIKEEVLASIGRTLGNRSNSRFTLVSEFSDISAEEYEQLQYFQADFAAYQSGVSTPPELEFPGDDTRNALRIEAYKQLVRLGVNQKYLRPDDVEQILVDMGILLESETSSEPSSNRNSYNGSGMDLDLDSFALPQDPSVSSPTNSEGFDQRFSGSADGKMAPQDDDAVAIGLFSNPHTSPVTAEEFQSRFPTKVVQGVRNPVDPERLIR